MATENKVVVGRSEYKGNAMISISNGGNDRFPFQFGVGKARKILAAIAEITAFVAEVDAKTAAAAPAAAPETVTTPLKGKGKGKVAPAPVEAAAAPVEA